MLKTQRSRHLALYDLLVGVRMWESQRQGQQRFRVPASANVCSNSGDRHRVKASAQENSCAAEFQKPRDRLIE
jgi:hypothetical protein